MKKHEFKRNSKRGGSGFGKGGLNRQKRVLFMKDKTSNMKYRVELEHVPESVVEVYFSRKGGGKNGKNLIGKDGQRLKCFRCGSDEHLEKSCPQSGGGHLAVSSAYNSRHHHHANVVMPSMSAYPTLSYAGYSPVTHRVGESSQAKAEEVDKPASMA